MTRGWRVIVLVTVVEGATVVLFTSMFKGCSIEVDFVTSTDAAEVVAAFVCWYLKEMKVMTRRTIRQEHKSFSET